MKRSCAFASLIVCLAPAAPAGAAAGEAPEPAPDAGTAGDAGPEEAPGARVLVLPTRAQVGAGVDAGAIDVLVAAAFQELGFEVVDARSVLAERCGSGGAPLVRARESYLDMDLEGALDIARSVQEEQLENRCDLLADPILEEADLFTVQILLDLGRKSEAYDLAERILVRHPNLRLDPVEFSPSMQALWAGAVKRMTGVPPDEPDPESLRLLGEEIGVAWVAATALAGSSGAWTAAVHLTPISGELLPSRHPVALGPRASWATNVRGALLERFAALSPPGPGSPLDDGADAGVTEEGDEWYTSWWFWTVVGVVVVGTVAGVLGGYYGSDDEEETPAVTGDFW